MRIRILFAVMVMVSALVLTACNSDNERTVYSGPTLTVTRQQGRTVIHDRAGGKTYALTERRVKRKSQTGTPKTLVSTDTLKITVQGSTTTIKTADGVRITITRHRLRR